MAVQLMFAKVLGKHANVRLKSFSNENAFLVPLGVEDLTLEKMSRKGM